MRTCAVIITYNPVNSLYENIQILSKCVDHIFIVDNGSRGIHLDRIVDCQELNRVSVVFLGVNIGLSAALNVALSSLKSMDFDWVLTLDQDSFVPEGMLPAMIDGYNRCKMLLKIGIISPIYKDVNAGVVSSGPICNNINALHCSEVDHAITSGSLIRFDIFEHVGFFDESYFIDYVDIEFCLRCRLAGYSVIQVDNAVLFHELGRSVQRRLLWKKPVATNHSPLRRYYFYRNAIFTYKKYFNKYPSWVIKNIIVLIKTLLVILLYEDEKFMKYKAFIYGLCDGFSGQSGMCKRNF